MEKAYELGATDYIRRPLKVILLTEELKTLNAL